MKKFKNILICCFIFLIFPFYVNGATENSEVWYGDNAHTCTSNYQDNNISTNGIAYFSYCMKATCGSDGRYSLSYYYSSNELKNKNMIVNCLNGNSNPYVTMHKNGCSNYSTCDKVNNIKYCSTIWKYDCSKKSDGSSFTTTTKKTTTKRKTNRTTSKTTETTTTAIISTKLKSISLSEGSLDFNSDVYEYDISINNEINNIEVTAIPEDNNCKVDVKNNTNLIDGSVISIIATSPNGNSNEYKINVKKEKELSNNANLKSLSVTNYDLGFKDNIKDYTLVIDEEDKDLDIKYEIEDEKTIVDITNNQNLTNGSKITIMVIAEDGTTNHYYINILVKEKSNVLGIIFIIVIVLAILAGAYYVYKKIIKPRSEAKYEYE